MVEKTLGHENIAHLRISGLLLDLVIILAFIAHLIAYSFSTTIYLALLVGTVFLYAFCRRKITISGPRYTLIWILAVFIAVFSLMRSTKDLNSIYDVICLCCAMLITVFYSSECADYIKGIKLIYAISLVFAFGIFCQMLIPSLYSLILRLLPSSYSTLVVNGIDAGTGAGRRGLTTNSGASAGYICAGLLAYISIPTDRKYKKPVKFFVILFLLTMLFFTGKRGVTLFLGVTVALRYILPERGTKKMKRLWFVFLFFAGILILYIVFSPLLTNIPFIGRIVETINGVIAGDDVSSLRLSLYSWAISLFKRHPLLGIGWGSFRATVVGNVSRTRALDVHNIYLQLLCETGIVGFVTFCLLFMSFWLYTKKALHICTKEPDLKESVFYPAVSFSFLYQTFFLLYGLTGNPLYDQHYLLLYAISCGIAMTFMHFDGMYNLKSQ